MPSVEIINGDHTPPWPFFIVDRHGLHVDLSKVDGQLWDPTVAKVTWGHLHPSGKTFGTVRLKNGQGRTFWDKNLMAPYLAAYNAAKAAIA
jgi:hypothetical protein